MQSSAVTFSDHVSLFKVSLSNAHCHGYCNVTNTDLYHSVICFELSLSTVACVATAAAHVPPFDASSMQS